MFISAMTTIIRSLIKLDILRSSSEDNAGSAKIFAEVPLAPSTPQRSTSHGSYWDGRYVMYYMWSIDGVDRWLPIVETERKVLV